MASAILSELRPFVFINLSGPPFIINIFFMLVNGLAGADKMSLCTSFRRVNSALPLATSGPAGGTFPPPPQVRDFTRHTYRLAILSPNSAPRPTDCPITATIVSNYRPRFRGRSSVDSHLVCWFWSGGRWPRPTLADRRQRTLTSAPPAASPAATLTKTSVTSDLAPGSPGFWFWSGRRVPGNRSWHITPRVTVPSGCEMHRHLDAHVVGISLVPEDVCRGRGGSGREGHRAWIGSGTKVIWPQDNRHLPRRVPAMGGRAEPCLRRRTRVTGTDGTLHGFILSASRRWP